MLTTLAVENYRSLRTLRVPIPGQSMFNADPEIKCEAAWAGPVLRPSTVLAQRSGPVVQLRGEGDGWGLVPHTLKPYDSMLSELADPQRAPDLLLLRERIRSWRFYDHLRTDATAPARAPQVGTRTMALAHDGADVAAALRTIVEIGDAGALAQTVDHAFPGSRIEIVNRDGRFELLLHQPGLARPLAAPELSDGTLRYLLLAAALLSPRPPQLLVLNEPETSLHPELLAPLGRLVARASEDTQIVVVSHSDELIGVIDEYADEPNMIELVKQDGATTVMGQRIMDEPLWYWPDR
ncbi:AAA family ATPase [Nocardia tengchongensis]|uniref:AAA family ATPase n=1 Tax=Nocardia tengchongensis TaxID=2055889 RepID=A0ABX8CIZ5_9NOCA|nr:AAA family ATPase [Nocardia tengchongensis]QVI18818.1 AAA family ATPase [Nocardia tengchongensis]